MYGEHLSKVLYVRNFLVAKKVSTHPFVSLPLNYMATLLNVPNNYTLRTKKKSNFSRHKNKNQEIPWGLCYAASIAVASPFLPS